MYENRTLNMVSSVFFPTRKTYIEGGNSSVIIRIKHYEVGENTSSDLVRPQLCLSCNDKVFERLKNELHCQYGHYSITPLKTSKFSSSLTFVKIVYNTLEDTRIISELLNNIGIIVLYGPLISHLLYVCKSYEFVTIFSTYS